MVSIDQAFVELGEIARWRGIRVLGGVPAPPPRYLPVRVTVSVPVHIEKVEAISDDARCAIEIKASDRLEVGKTKTDDNSIRCNDPFPFPESTESLSYEYVLEHSVGE
jgi:hypothetical protein